MLGCSAASTPVTRTPQTDWSSCWPCEETRQDSSGASTSAISVPRPNLPGCGSDRDGKPERGGPAPDSSIPSIPSELTRVCRSGTPSSLQRPTGSLRPGAVRCPEDGNGLLDRRRARGWRSTQVALEQGATLIGRHHADGAEDQHRGNEHPDHEVRQVRPGQHGGSGEVVGDGSADQPSRFLGEPPGREAGRVGRSSTRR